MGLVKKYRGSPRGNTSNSHHGCHEHSIHKTMMYSYTRTVSTVRCLLESYTTHPLSHHLVVSYFSFSLSLSFCLSFFLFRQNFGSLPPPSIPLILRSASNRSKLSRLRRKRNYDIKITFCLHWLFPFFSSSTRTSIIIIIPHVKVMECLPCKFQYDEDKCYYYCYYYIYDDNTDDNGDTSRTTRTVVLYYRTIPHCIDTVSDTTGIVSCHDTL
jgi:hypothetical protein